jgi:hypothetical protein
MLAITVARQVNELTRGLWGFTLGSGNKGYGWSVNALWNAPNQFQLMQKWHKRNSNRKEAEAKVLFATRAAVLGKGWNFLEKGKHLFNLAYDSPETFAGNCGEMSCVAVYLANFWFNVPSAQLFIVDFTKGRFQHNSAFFGRNSQEGAFCDPWLNVCCMHWDYEDMSDRKLMDWTSKCKRLYLGKSPNLPEHVAPSDPEVYGFSAPQYRTVYNCTQVV